MSAFMVSDKTLKILAMEISKRSSVPLEITREEGLKKVNDILHALWNENVKSLKYRYDDRHSDMYGECPTLTISELMKYEPKPTGALAKYLACYEYQSCEHPSWEESSVHRMCRWFAGSLLKTLPGYEEAEWG